VTQPPLEREPDGWTWADDRWRERVEQSNDLALVVEALRRVIDLRDTLAESGSQDTVRALFLTDVLNTLFEVVVRRRATELGFVADPPHGTGAEIVEALYEAGLLKPSTYRPAPVG
jgi:hypothetical protein